MKIGHGLLEPNAAKAVLELKEFVETTELEETLINLIEIRVTQISGVWCCLDMHIQDVIAMGEKEQRTFCLAHG